MATYNSRHLGTTIDNFDNRISELTSNFNNLNESINEINNKLLSLYSGTFLVNNWEWYDSTEQISQDITTYKNKWYCEFFSNAAVNSGSYSELKTATPRTDIPARYSNMHTTTSGNLFGVHSYRCRATTYLYCAEAKSISFRWDTDDEGAAWCNGELLGTNASCAWSATYTINLHKGCNEICIIYHEGSGGEWFITEPDLSIVEGITMAAINMGGYRQTITPTTVFGKQCNSNSIFFAPTITSNNYNNITDLRLIKDFGFLYSSANNSVTLQTTNNIKLDHDLTIYWLGY